MTKLHLGSGEHIFTGWDNLDLMEREGIIHCDLTKPLPYETNSVNFIFTEHFIEHLDEVDGFNLLVECFRVMKPGGKIRITCPDLRKYVEAYLNWNPANYSDGELFTSGTNFLNFATLGEAVSGLRYLSPIQTSHNHGHKYYYDEADLTSKLKDAGFINPVSCQYHQSTSPELAGLEQRLPMKDLSMEAAKPG